MYRGGHHLNKPHLHSHSFISFSVSQDYEYPNHPQSTQHQKNDRCPPPPQMLPERACEVPGCRSDSECERHKRCCYNGCIYACLESVQPPPGQPQTVPHTVVLGYIRFLTCFGEYQGCTNLHSAFFFFLLFYSLFCLFCVCVCSEQCWTGWFSPSLGG